MSKDNKKRSPVVKLKASTMGLEIEKLKAEVDRLKKELKNKRTYGIAFERKKKKWLRCVRKNCQC